MSVESFLTRELDIRFVDAKHITNEAKASLGLQGYPDKAQLREIRDEAMRIYKERSEEERRQLHQKNADLQETKLHPPAPPSVTGTYYVSDDEQSDEDDEDITIRSDVLEAFAQVHHPKRASASKRRSSFFNVFSRRV